MKEKIIQKAIELFMMYGIKSVSMDDIARHAGMSKKTLYLNIEDKKALIQDALKSYLKSDLEKMQLIFNASSHNALQKMIAFQMNSVDLLSKMKPTLLYDMRKYYRDSWKIMNDFYFKDVLKILEQNIQEGQIQGIYRSCVQSSIIAKVFIRTIYSFNDETYYPFHEFRFMDLHNQATWYHLYGIVSQKGFTQLTEYLENQKS